MSDLDDEELKATRILNGADKKTADEMFEELEYKKTEDIYEIRYSYTDKKENYNNTDIVFYKRYKQIETYLPEYRNDFESDSAVLTMQELRAINKKCEELGWI